MEKWKRNIFGSFDFVRFDTVFGYGAEKYDSLDEHAWNVVE